MGSCVHVCMCVWMGVVLEAVGTQAHGVRVCM